MKKQPTEKEMISRKDGMKGFKIGILMGKQQTFAEVMKIIDEYCIGYNQFNSIGEMSRMVEVKELKERIEKTAQEITNG